MTCSFESMLSMFYDGSMPLKRIIGTGHIYMRYVIVFTYRQEEKAE